MTVKPQYSTKLQDVADPFDIAPGVKPSLKSSTSYTSSAEQDAEAQQRLREIGNKKGISSADVFGKREQKSDEVTQRYQ